MCGQRLRKPRTASGKIAKENETLGWRTALFNAVMDQFYTWIVYVFKQNDIHEIHTVHGDFYKLLDDLFGTAVPIFKHVLAIHGSQVQILVKEDNIF